ncbi:MJ0548 connectase family domain-containing protein [Methanofollis ethanolicus]|uniref:MJ0548 connectase family domain-containing protein n=1 Tax=Methanofollis ethanolicus TaxID=488124 RepID=UPI001F1CA074|nr:DUF2121 domain-containing protein [Methanofollis ethanolicus]
MMPEGSAPVGGVGGMSLVIAFVGSKSAVMAGDMREIFFWGDETAVQALEKELYGGGLVADNDLYRRAEALGVGVVVRDGREKVREQDGVLVGEVRETVGGTVRARRLYATAGRYAIAEFEGSCGRLTGKGTGSTFVVLGNRAAQAIALASIREGWKDGGTEDAVRVIILVMKTAAAATASVSKRFVLIRTEAGADLDTLLARDLGEGEVAMKNTSGIFRKNA